MMTYNRLEMLIQDFIKKIERGFELNPNHSVFSLETREIKSHDEAKLLAEHFQKFDFFISIEQKPDGGFIIRGDKSFEVNRKIQNEEMNKLIMEELKNRAVGTICFQDNFISKDNNPIAIKSFGAIRSLSEKKIR